MTAPLLSNMAKPYLFLGYFSFETIMLAVLGIHTVICISLVALASSVVDVEMYGFTLNTTLQLVAGTWGLLGIVSIVSALVGWSQQRETPMAVYFWYLLISAVVLAVIFVYLATNNSKCYFIHEDLQTQRIGYSFLCSIVASAIFFVGLAAVAAVLFAVYTIVQVQGMIRESVREQLSERSRLLLREKQIEAARAAGCPDSWRNGCQYASYHQAQRFA
ncbi:unnamed protein product [Cladocopium goreaui]|uniref:AarF domain-containing protein kinase, chloroplastic n=1 Tax=Cladocopium goreaui TaxID=2562237 RepID=A0A9P1CBC8_9DINO|nr:unnamed protein product [Cladocopium goreaui]